MALEERFGNRDAELAYSQWHRSESTARFIGKNLANSLSMINVDHPVTIWAEFNNFGKTVALIEGALYTGSYKKPYFVTKDLAERAGIMAFVVLYSLSDEINPMSEFGCRDITLFQVKQVYPNEWAKFETFYPEQYARFLLALREHALDEISKKQDGILGEIKELLTSLNNRLEYLEKKMSVRLYEKDLLTHRSEQLKFNGRG